MCKKRCIIKMSIWALNKNLYIFMEPTTPHTNKTLVVLVIVIIVAAIIWLLMKKMPVPNAPVTTTPTNSYTSMGANASTDASLNQDSAAIDSQINGLDSDTAA